MFAYVDVPGVQIFGLPVPKGSRETTVKLKLPRGAKPPEGDVQLVSGLNEFVGVYSNTMNRASAPARVTGGEK